jgi:hypothetical protein
MLTKRSGERAQRGARFGIGERRVQSDLGRRQPSAILSEMVGAVLLSRVITDEAMADALIGDVLTDIIGPRSPRPEARDTETSHKRSRP